MIKKLSIRWLLAMCTLPAFALQGCGQGRQKALSETEEPSGSTGKVPSVPHSGGRLEADSRTPPSHLGHWKEEPLQRVNDLGVKELRNFLAGKQLRPPGLVAGMESFEANGKWKAFIETTIATSREGFWEVRPGQDDKPELCTTETRRNAETHSVPRTVCRNISVSIEEHRAELNDPGFQSRKYFTEISEIEK